MTEAAVKWCAVCAVCVVLIGSVASVRGCQLYVSAMRVVGEACVQAGGSWILDQCAGKNHDIKLK